MVVALISPAKAFLCLSSSNSISPSSSSSSSSTSSAFFPQKHNAVTVLPFCNIKAVAPGERESAGVPSLSKRGFALSLSSAFLLCLFGRPGGNCGALAAVLEAEDDLELLEKVKQDRKKRIERQAIINSSKKETGYLQDLVYKLRKIGQAIDNNDLNTASSVLGSSTDTDWLKNANSAFSKLTSSPEEKAEVDVFNSSISELISSVAKKDMELSKIAFVSSASALEKWTALTGLVDKLKGL